MSKYYLLFIIGLCGLFSCSSEEGATTNNSSSKAIQVKYPTTQKGDVIEDYHGTKIPDPYRWLEDDNSKETVAWVKEQNKATFDYLEQIPSRKTFQNRLEKLWNYERFSVPAKRGGKYYFSKNDGLQNQAVLYVQNDLDSEAKVVLDPNKFSEDGTTALGGTSFNEDGTMMAYQVSEGGSDWQTAYIKNMETGEVLDDKIEWIKFSGLSWQGDGFFYSRYPEPTGDAKLSGRNEKHQVWYHKVGTSQDQDELVYLNEKNPTHGYYAGTTHDERFLALQVWESTSGNGLLFKDLEDKNSDFVKVIEGFNYDYNVVDNIGDQLLIKTNDGAPNQRLMLMSTKNPDKKNWKEIIPESKDVLQSISIIGNKIVATYIHDASSKIEVFSLEGKPEGSIKLPGIGTVGSISGKREEDTAFYSFTSFTRPTTIYKLDMKTLESTVFKAPKIDFNPDLYETNQVWYKSKDGTEIPMFVTHKKGLKMDGKRPTLLYGYGGFDISILPGFNTTRLSMCPIVLENDGVFAVANIRGGGEFGADWHKAGTLGQKQNVFDDFQAAAEHLIAKKYTSSDKLAIYGRSNGGLLVGACLTQRPDLYAVALPAVGVLDMLRYQEFTIGRAWASDYGLSEEKEGFDYLSKYSPLHNVKEKEYPATMITTADHDDRVVPAHSFKFAAELQAKQQGDNPVLIRIETGAGHGAGKSTTKKIEEASDLLAFMFHHFGENIE